ncbi:type II toxin-antitoxin system PemK/MazF family toxin [Lactobacillus crispatus]|mgnify:FL=1|jgi:ppGpp-regulated growth inhibitor|uniref:Type II toxin-antitoxin system PemK/MazF family toxin n=1 Tax=Lactobacillus crispatus TaxID=47770 RepID=A0A5M9YZ70_9LACO|nr:type II toxin-antitoxin system PemK/MazF family toxin [Lactobacillus crispatus]EEX29553.1 PemK-like protein [Lactobacillus crispatus MV-3A-US]EFD98723.1 toxin-antitoxin system, toxin component, MazF family [Lactobacillus crispatus 214-1]KAA8794909.1 type II toxin-antitoxin system PemK/MazF family toxin [Lactobacillus crispatus]KAA8811537.1 type II toxin-antitoxin system PemK/MazF family toxin [Lactobacillus crispatus]KRK29760.1 ppGpp-regulated growth inhibitor [Lactobacillus crispatus DSM 2
MIDVHQGDIIIIGFDPSLGHEQQGTRPALIVSNHDFTRLTRSLVKVVPISKTENDFPLHIPVPEGLKVHGVAEAQQETTLDLAARHWYKVDHAPASFIKDVINAISDSYEFEE